MAMLSPVCGLRPCRAARVLVVKVPKPGRTTLSPRASASAIAESTASTALWACALDIAVWLATWAERSDFFMGVFLGTGGRRRLHSSAPGRVGAIGFDAVEHLVPCRVEKRLPRLDVDPSPPKANASKTSAAGYLCLTFGGVR